MLATIGPSSGIAPPGAQSRHNLGFPFFIFHRNTGKDLYQDTSRPTVHIHYVCVETDNKKWYIFALLFTTKCWYIICISSKWAISIRIHLQISLLFWNHTGLILYRSMLKTFFKWKQSVYIQSVTPFHKISRLHLLFFVVEFINKI